MGFCLTSLVYLICLLYRIYPVYGLPFVNRHRESGLMSFFFQDDMATSLASDSPTCPLEDSDYLS